MTEQMALTGSSQKGNYREPVKFGIIGCGKIAVRFSKALKRSPEAVLAACAARESGRAEAFAKEHGIPKAYGDYQSLLEDEEIQAVYIATVHTTHAGIAQACIRAGKAVLSEKPFFTNGKEAAETIALARKSRVLVMEGFWTRTMPAYLKVKEWIREGRIGHIRVIRAAASFMLPYTEDTKKNRLWDPALGGGAMLDMGVYPYEYVTGIMDGPPEKVNYTVQMSEAGVDTIAVMTLSYPGAIADCATSITAFTDNTATISGDTGYIKQYRFTGSRKCELYDFSGKLLDSYEETEEEDGFVHEIAHFTQLFHAGKTESDLIPLEHTLDFARQAEKILEAASEMCRSKDGKGPETLHG